MNLVRGKKRPNNNSDSVARFQNHEDGQKSHVSSGLVRSRAALVLDAQPNLFYKVRHLPVAENLSQRKFEADHQRFEVS